MANTLHHVDDRHRKSIRLRGYDYATRGVYFVTICTHDRICLFGEVEDGAVRLNEAGETVRRVWTELPSHHAKISLDAFVVMPNHVHGTIALVGAQFIAPSPTNDGHTPHAPGVQGDQPHHSGDRGDGSPGQGAHARGTRGKGVMNHAPTLGEIIRGFKARTTRLLRRDLGCARVWQRNFYDRIVRDDDELEGIRQYIHDNPLQWPRDCENRTSS